MKKKPSPEIQRLVLLDVHAILHRAYHALPEFASSKGEPTGALYGLVTMLLKIIGELKPDYIAACYDLPEPTYRHEAYDGYKAKREKTDDALVAQIIRSQDVFRAFGIPAYSKAGFEADDMLGTIVEQMKGKPGLEIVIASGDMDTLQLVDGDAVKVYTLKKGINDTILYDEEKVRDRFGFAPALLPDYKGLRGDPSDNIIGVKGIGEKTATILIQTFGMLEKMYARLRKDTKPFKDAGLTDRVIALLVEGEEEAMFSKMLATIRRDAPIEFSLGPQWRNSLIFADAEALFAELEFRTLSARLKDVLDGRSSKGAKEKKEEAPIQASFNAVQEEAIPPSELEEVAVALWVVDSNITNPTLDDILNFARTRDFKKAKRVILDELKKRNGLVVYDEIEKPLIPVLHEMENYGVKIDRSYLADLSHGYHKKLDALQKAIWREAGMEFNINSPKQLGEVLFDTLGLTAKGIKKTAGGARSTKESELEKLRESHPVIPLVLEYRMFQKLLSTYIDTIPNLLDGHDRLHTNLRQTGTTTGRMSSTDPNIQNIPIKGEFGRNIRRAFVAEEGFIFTTFDYSQIELRVAAILSGDEKLLGIFRKGEDVHQSVASYVFNVSPEKVDKEMRRKAKVINFGILYGMGVNALRQNLGGSREEAQRFYSEYFSEFTGITEYLNQTKASAARLGYTETLFGRRRYVEGIKSKLPFIRAAAERMAINAPVQGTAADLMKLAMTRISEFIKKEGLSDEVRMLLQVHDELVFEIKKEKLSEVAPLIKAIMENVLTSKESKGIVCVANASAGSSWADAETL